MRNRIRIKVKHIIYILSGMLIIIYFLLPNALFNYAKAMENSDIESSKVFYKRYASLYPYGSKRAEALYNLGREIVPDDISDTRYKIYASSFSMGGKTITLEMINNSAACYKEILEKYGDSEYYTKAYGNLMNLYTQGGRFEEGRKLINQGIGSENSNIKFIASKYKMLYLFIAKEYDEAEKIGTEYAEIYKADHDIYSLLGDINFYQRKFDSALNFYNKAMDGNIQKSAYDREYTMNYSGITSPYNKISLVKKIKDGYTGSNEIYGRIVINGKAAPNVYVYLKDEKDGNLNSLGDEQDCITGVTDFNGNYAIPSLPEGNYILGVGIPTTYLDNTVFEIPDETYFQLGGQEKKEYNFSFSLPMKMIEPTGTVVPKDGKVEVQWEKVIGAAYYIVRLVEFENPLTMEGSYSAFSAGDKILDTRYTIDINKLNMEVHGFMMDMEGRLNPQAYIGIFYPGSRVPIYVEAYDKGGRRLKSSSAIRMNARDLSIINVPEEGLSEGDKLVLDKRVEDAVISYEKELEINPNDIHALTVLSRIYSTGTSREYENEGSSTIESRDIAKAKCYLERLYDITGDVFYLKQELGTDYVEPENPGEALEKYKAIPEKDLNTDDFARIAEFNLTLKNYREADKYFEKIYTHYKDTNYYNLAPVLLRVYLKDYDNSLRFLDILDLQPYRVNKDILIACIEKIKTLDKNTEDYKKFEEAVDIMLSFRKDKDYRVSYRSIYSTVTEPTLSAALKEIGNYYHIFDNY